MSGEKGGVLLEAKSSSRWNLLKPFLQPLKSELELCVGGGGCVWSSISRGQRKRGVEVDEGPFF